MRNRIKSGKIILVRHGMPSLSRDCSLTPAEYERWWAQYDESGLADGERPPDELVDAARFANHLYSSTARRAQETAGWISNGQPVESDNIFIEAALPKPPLPFLRLGPSNWGWVSRSFWFLGYSPNHEGHMAAMWRAFAAAGRLSEAANGGGDVVMCGHGYFNYMINVALRGKGWQCVYNGGSAYWSWRKYVRRETGQTISRQLLPSRR